MSDARVISPERPTQRNHAGQFKLVSGGLCDVYTRKNRVTLFFYQDGKASAFHMEVPVARDASSALLTASEMTPYDEGAA